MTLGEKLQKLRKAAGLSQEQLAEKLLVSRQAISKWEQDAARPDTDNIIVLSELFGVTTDYLLKAEGEKGTGPLPFAGKEGGSTEEEEPYTIRVRQKVKAVRIATLFVAGAGLLLSNVLWVARQEISLTSIGIFLQLLCIAVFEVFLLQKCSGTLAAEERCRFYRVAVWLILPYIVFFTMAAAWRLYPWPHHSLLSDGINILVYLCVCGAATCLLNRRLKKGRASEGEREAPVEDSPQPREDEGTSDEI